VAVSPDRDRAYVTTVARDANAVTVIDTATNTVVATVPVQIGPYGAAVTPDSSRVWVTNVTVGWPDAVTVIDAATNAIVGLIPILGEPRGVAVTPAGTEVYVAAQDVNIVAVINEAGLSRDASIPANSPTGVAVSPDGGKLYVTNEGGSNTVSVFETVTNLVVATIPVGLSPAGVAVSPDGSRLYVTNQTSNTVSVITRRRMR
jgi:YVTN family beta-propeller protein